MKRILALSSLIVLVAAVVAGCEFSVSTANITQAVLAKDVQGSNFDPVDVTTSFAPDQPVMHLVVSVANAPSDTQVKSAWTAVDVGDAAPANTKIDEATVTMNSSGNAHFTLSRPNNGAWPPGKYKVDVYLNDKLNRTLEYTVQ